MKIRFSVLCLLCLASATLLAQSGTSAGNPVDQRTDYPELSQRGPNPVGFRVVEVVDPHRIDFLHPNPAPGPNPEKAALYDRHLFVTIWYPAATGDAKTVAHYDRHQGAGPGTPFAGSAQFPQTGLAIADAPAKHSAAPLVIYSHGFTNWAAHVSQLGEVLASRGYVFASIDHDDIPFQDGKSAGLSFLNTASGRSKDQRAVAAQLRAWANDPSFPLAGAYDPDNLALAGYSMGGFGALTSAGAGYDPKGALFQQLPKEPFDGVLEGQAQPIPGLKALVLFAPWGGQPRNRSWSAAALASIHVPTLLVDGNNDDIAGYPEGVRWIYDNLKSTDRFLLTFENARHNIVGVEAPPAAYGSYGLVEKWDEPVWRKDRIEAIDDHFVVAFLDRYLRNDAGMDGYLHPPTVHSNDGVWPPARGADAGSPFAGHDAASAQYWKGFQRRWALGLELEHLSPGQSAPPAPAAQDKSGPN
jgi:predicted dienelactone hydrolase